MQSRWAVSQILHHTPLEWAYKLKALGALHMCTAVCTTLSGCEPLLLHHMDGAVPC